MVQPYREATKVVLPIGISFWSSNDCHECWHYPSLSLMVRSEVCEPETRQLKMPLQRFLLWDSLKPMKEFYGRKEIKLGYFGWIHYELGVMIWRSKAPFRLGLGWRRHRCQSFTDLLRWSTLMSLCHFMHMPTLAVKAHWSSLYSVDQMKTLKFPRRRSRPTWKWGLDLQAGPTIVYWKMAYW